MKNRKFIKVEHDNKKRVFKLHYDSGLVIDCPYSALRINKKVVESAPDKEVGSHSFYFVLDDGKKDYVPFDQPLHIVQNPEYVKDQALYNMTKALNVFIKEEKVSKRELSRRLKTSLSQLARLLDTTNYKKDMSRLIEIASMLNYSFTWEFKKAA